MNEIAQQIRAIGKEAGTVGWANVGNVKDKALSAIAKAPSVAIAYEIAWAAADVFTDFMDQKADGAYLAFNWTSKLGLPLGTCLTDSCDVRADAQQMKNSSVQNAMREVESALYARGQR